MPRDLASAQARSPVLVVPTFDDVEWFERELVESGDEPLLGGRVVTFDGLVDELALAHELPDGRALGLPARAWLAREAVERCSGELRALAGTAGRPGFPPALARCFEELEAAMVLPADFRSAATAEVASEAERELGLLYESWWDLREERMAGAVTEHGACRELAVELNRVAATGEAGPWGGRPVYLYGFDDLTAEQVDLVGALAAVTEVTASVTYEPSRRSLEARARLLQELTERVPAELRGPVVEKASDGTYTDNEILCHLEAGFLAADLDDPEGSRMRVDGESGFKLLRSAGSRAEAELVGVEVSRLLRKGTGPEEIAIVLRSPSGHAALWVSVLEGMGIPVAAEATVGLGATTVGRALALLATLAAGNGSAADLVSYLRVPGRAWAESKVDRLERTVMTEPLTTAAEAEAEWEALEGRDLFELRDLREAGGGATLLEQAARLVRMIAQYPLEGTAELASGRAALELRAAAAAAREMEDLAALGPEDFALTDLAELVQAISFPFHSGPTHGRVRLVSPYRLRAQRVDHLFVCSLQDGEFPRRSEAAQLISHDLRRVLGLPDRTQPVLEERYLFATCLARPRISLTLSWRDLDEEGNPLAASGFIEEVRDLLSVDPEVGGPDPLFTVVGTERGLTQVVLPPDAAGSERELARSIANLGRARWEQALAGADGGIESELRSRLGRADWACEPSRLRPTDLHSERTLGALADRSRFGATTLEGYLECSYRWFVDKELKPVALEPPDTPLTFGSLAHAVLERVFREQPGGPLRVAGEGEEAGPRPDALRRWQERVDELVDELAERFGLASEDPIGRAKIAGLKFNLRRYLEAEATQMTGTLLPDPEMIEVSFGQADSPKPALELDGLELEGKIDRVDTREDEAGGETGLVVDYKYSGARDTATQQARDGKLQLPLYSLALRELWGIRPAGGVYVPLRASAPRPRGPMLEEERGEGLVGKKFLYDQKSGGFPGDFRPAPDFEDVITEAVERAEAAAAGVRSGKVSRNPWNQSCPAFCTFQGICRIEHGRADAEGEE